MKQLLEQDIFKPIAKEEIPIRKKEYFKSVFDDLEKEGKLIHNEDGTVDIKGNLHLHNMNLTSLLDLPCRIKRITGSFYCDDNQLTSLEGAPRGVGGDFTCWGNKLPKDVEIPSEVKGKIYRGN